MSKLTAPRCVNGSDSPSLSDRWMKGQSGSLEQPEHVPSNNFKGVKMKRVIEIRAAEGGDDSKLFVSDLAKAYISFASRVG